jgi:hypothetical protein
MRSYMLVRTRLMADCTTFASKSGSPKGRPEETLLEGS